MAATVVYVANTSRLLLNGLQDESDDSYINDAAVTATIKDSAGADVPGEGWPRTMAYIALSNGNYAVTLTKDLGIVHKGKYTAFIDAVATVGLNERVGHWEFPLEGRTRVS